MIEVRTIEFGSPEFLAALEIRNEVLRRPLGLSYSPEAILQEKTQVHFCAFLANESEHSEKVVGVLILRPPLEAVEQIGVVRQVAVDASMQGQGVGRLLMEKAEAAAIQLGCSEIQLHARQSVATFYEKLGYKIVGEPFIEVSIPHLFMVKKLL